MDPNDITYFAETDARNKKIRFGIKAKDRLKHVYVIGKTGMGKSTLLENMAIQDIQNGNGIAFIDPHGGTAEKLLDYVPEHRVKDVLYFAPFDLEYPISFNVLEDIGVDKRHLVVNGLMSTFEKIWVDAWSARMAYILNNTLLALLEYPKATLLGVNRMLADKDYRKKVVENVKDPSVKAFWIEEFGKYTERFAAEATPAIQNKVGQFTSNPLVRNLIGQSDSTFDIRKIMDEKKIMIINLSKGRVGEGNANLIGSMLITKIYLAAMSRADRNEQELAKLPNFYLYVDEFQSFANKSFADILSEARKYKLNLTIAHQYVEQMEEEVRDAVFGNVGTMMAFRVGAMDSELLEKEFAPVFTAEDLVNLGFAQIYLKLMIDGVSSQPFSAITMGPIKKPDITFKDQVIEMSRKQFAKPRADVEKNIHDWHIEGTSNAPRPAILGSISSVAKAMEDKSAGEKVGSNVSFGSSQNTSRPFVQTPPRVPLGEKSGKENFGRGTDQRSANTNVGTGTSPDPNKSAFLKASEELHAKIESKEHLSTEKREMVRASLGALASREHKKEPSIENISSLKSALSQVINKSSEEKKPMPNVQTPKETPKPIIEKKEVISNENNFGRGTDQRSANTNIGTGKKEVPEETLRKILDMDEK